MKYLGKIAFAASLMTAGPVAAADVGGAYSVSGTNFDGSRYEGTAWIESTGGSTCSIRWETGSTTSQGHCMLSGDRLAAAYTLGSVIGLVIYELRRDGSLDGIWTVAGSEGHGTEVLTPR